jgi:hypothetical protein
MLKRSIHKFRQVTLVDWFFLQFVVAANTGCLNALSAFCSRPVQAFSIHTLVLIVPAAACCSCLV